RFAGLVVQGDGNPKLRRCKIRDGKLAGIVIRQGGVGNLDGCEISGNGSVGLLVARAGNPTLRRCTITRNADVGVLAQRGASGDMEGCDLTGNRGGDVELDSGAGMRLGDNQLEPE